MTEAPAPALHHVALTVSDLDASVAWYTELFGLQFLTEVPHQGGTAMILVAEGHGVAFALHRHDASARTLFDERTTGLDHVGMMVGTRADLEQWQDHLEAHGVVRSDAADKPLTQSPIADEYYGSVLVFRDPDNIQLELFAPVETRGPVPGASA
jgi:catechol 2,3-dioxygenase-like lactoylglutathione lyase family enzyme